MSSLKQYFTTNWAAMTLHDWIGMAITLIIFVLMIALYVYVFHPSNKARLEQHRNIPLDDDRFTAEDKQ